MIVHCVNDAGFWGAGFTASLDQHWPNARRSYLGWTTRMLGAVLVAPLAEDVHVVHLCAQYGIRNTWNRKPLRLDALDRALTALAALGSTAPLHMPRIGCGLAGGAWHEVEPLLLKHLGTFDVTVYR